jgi:endonuclease/exonuclease/phosphatase family metal-dependent hydrolase
MISKPFKTFFILLPVFILLGITLIASCGSSTTSTPPGPDNGNNGNGQHTGQVIDTLRVFVYNIQHGRGMDDEVDIERIADVIREKDPHLVALNEVDVGVERSGGIDITAMLGEYLGMEHVFGMNIPHQGGEYGNGILTNLPLLSSQNLHLDMPEGGEQRGLLQTEVEFSGVSIAFMTTHLDHRSAANRAAGVERILETAQEYAGMPVLATGDFNALPDDPVISRMTAHFTDVWDEVGEGPGYTIPVPAARANRRIDYIFYTNDLVEEGGPTLRAIHMEVIDSTASDHLPIYAELELVY